MGTYSFKLPDVGEGMHEGEIVKWLIKPGDTVEEDQVIVEVQNDKSVVELPSSVSGKVKELKVEEGTTASVGDVLAIFEVEGDEGGSESAETGDEAEAAASGDKPGESEREKSADAGSASPAAKPQKTDAEESKAVEAGNGVSASREVLATPSVRRFAREQEVEMAQVPATGRHGQVTRQDVELYLSGGGKAGESQPKPAGQAGIAGDVNEAQDVAGVSAPSAAGDAVERVPLKGIRKVIAQSMVKSVYTAPHVTIMDEADVSALVEYRRKVKPLAEKKGVKLTYLPFIVKALVAAARNFPILNASVDDEKNEIVYKKYYNIGIAADTDNGLIVPVVKEADRKNIWTIAEEIGDLALRGREGKLSADEMKNSTITITNIGSAGGMFFTPVINYPEAAILGTGRISEKPVVKDGELAIGQLMALSLSFDHRIIDGATAQYAMNYIKELLADPQMMILEV